MIKISSILLRISLVFLLMRKGLGKFCYQTNFEQLNNCFLTASDKKKLIECWQKCPIELEELLPSKDDCIKATYTLEDDTKLIIVGVTNTTTSSENDSCKSLSTTGTIKQILEEKAKMKVKDYKCTHCHEDRCNGKKKEGIRCYHSDPVPTSCSKKIFDMNDFISCAGQAAVKQKEECEQCLALTLTDNDNRKTVGLAICGNQNETCESYTRHYEEIHKSPGFSWKNLRCVFCKYDLCNDLQKEVLSRNEAGNQVVSNPTVIIFISLLVSLMC